VRFLSSPHPTALEDCGSTNGTFKENGEKVSPDRPVYLQPGERFYLGEKNEMFEVGLEGRI
jgi:pSer/pThr/pTyr-binding forkhead associated (FHA) protein